MGGAKFLRNYTPAIENQLLDFRCGRRGSDRSRRLFRRRDGDYDRIARTIAVDEITTDQDDDYRPGDGPVSAAVRSEPFVQDAFVVLNNRAISHVRSPFCRRIMEKHPRTRAVPVRYSQPSNVLNYC